MGLRGGGGPESLNELFEGDFFNFFMLFCSFRSQKMVVQGIKQTCIAISVSWFSKAGPTNTWGSAGMLCTGRILFSISEGALLCLVLAFSSLYIPILLVTGSGSNLNTACKYTHASPYTLCNS